MTPIYLSINQFNQMNQSINQMNLSINQMMNWALYGICCMMKRGRLLSSD